jgi:hypothetical protein
MRRTLANLLSALPLAETALAIETPIAVESV